jgi:8-oxo-dGTP pyrophosphatase MutT (NUDIX family)
MGARDERVVQAAGDVIVRHTPRGEIQVPLVHRPHREDWTFPKGKLEAGESHERCALREVEEETGLRCKLGAGVARQGRGVLSWRPHCTCVPWRICVGSVKQRSNHRFPYG